MRRMCRRRWRLRARYSAHRAGALACTEIRPRAACAGMAEAWQQRREQGKRKRACGLFFVWRGGVWGEGESRKLRQGESRCNKRCLFKLQSIEGRGFFLFLPKGSEKGEGDRQVSPFTPSCPGRVLPGLLRGGKGFYVSGVMMLLGPPGTIPRRACCGRCVSWAAYGQARLGRRQGKRPGAW